MSVVTRGVMAAGMAIYAAIHFSQALSNDQMTVAWANAGFGATALLAAALALGLIVSADRRIEHVAAGLAGLSMVLVVLTHTVGLFGVSAGSLEAPVLVVIVAEISTMLAWAAEQFAPSVGHISRQNLEDAPFVQH